VARAVDEVDVGVRRAGAAERRERVAASLLERELEEALVALVQLQALRIADALIVLARERLIELL